MDENTNFPAAKKITVIVGSPRKNGNTEILANAFVKGAKESGNYVDVIFVTGLKVNSCIGCNYCYRNDGCFFDDDMTEIYKRLAVADIIVFATPIYFYGISSQLKCIVDRLHNPVRNSFKVKKLVLLAVCADISDKVFDSVKTMYKSVLNYFSLQDGGIISVSGMENKGDIINSTALNEAYMLGFKC